MLVSIACYRNRDFFPSLLKKGGKKGRWKERKMKTKRKQKEKEKEIRQRNKNYNEKNTFYILIQNMKEKTKYVGQGAVTNEL